MYFGQAKDNSGNGDRLTDLSFRGEKACKKIACLSHVNCFVTLVITTA